MSYNTKNYREQGGDKWVIGGEIEFTGDGVLLDNQPASTATDVSGIVTDFNTLLASLKEAGIMTPDEEPAPEVDPEGDESGDQENV